VTTTKIADANVTQAKLASGVAGNGPAFGAYRTSNQSISSVTFTKVACDNEEFDTASCFDTSNNRFTPNVAGYYYFGGTVVLQSGSPTRVILSVYKNGSETKRLLDSLCSASAAGSTGSCILYMNGSTDYVELYTYWNAAISITGNQVECNFYGSLLRAA
jgi:hypothetical protein